MSAERVDVRREIRHGDMYLHAEDLIDALEKMRDTVEACTAECVDGLNVAAECVRMIATYPMVGSR